jgi:hypothetical protein
MEDVLEVYETPYDPTHPGVCFDESPKQLIGEVRTPLPPHPGTPARQDTEYRRHGVRNLMMICEPKRGGREVLVMERRTHMEFAQCMRQIVALYPKAESIRVVLDNLNTHSPASLYSVFPPEEARTIARKLEFHYTPKQGSWRGIAEIEWAVLANFCLSKRIPDALTLQRQINASVQLRNAKALPVNWRFTTQDARRKLARLYPSVTA